MTEYPFSERQACRLLEVDRTSYRYEAAGSQCRIAGGAVALAREKPRWGYRRLWAVLTRQGWR